MGHAVVNHYKKGGSVKPPKIKKMAVGGNVPYDTITDAVNPLITGTVKNKKTSNVLSSIVSGAGTGAAVGGPWGALAGAAVGTATGLMGNSAQDDATKLLKDKQLQSNAGILASIPYAQGAAQGGEIKGAGTAKSDSIATALPPGSFVVPAENAKKAEKIRAKYLGEPTEPADTGTGAPVKLSNGEHVFTPAEKAKLLEHGVDLDALAPNAEKGIGKKDGGEVDLNTTIKELESRQQKLDSYQKALEEAQSKTKVTELVKKEQDKLRSTIAAKQKQINDLKANLQNQIKGVKNPARSSGKSETDAQILAAKGTIQAIKKAQDEIDNIHKSTKTKKEEATAKNNKVLDTDQKGIYDVLKSASEKTNTATPVAPKATAPVVPSTTPKKTTTASTKKASVTKSDRSPVTPIDTPEVTNVDDAAKDVSESTNPPALTPSTPSVDDPSKSSDKKTDTTQSSGARNVFEKLGGVAGLLSFGQTAFGLGNLISQGARPSFITDPTLVNRRDEAIADARSGIDPAVEAAAKDSIELNRRAEMDSIKQMTGGDAGTALANQGAATTNANRGVLNLLAEKERIRTQKNLRADNLTGAVTAENDKKFDYSNKAFYDNQAANAELMQAGISNFIGNKQLQAEQEKADAREEKYGNTQIKSSDFKSLLSKV